MYRLLLAEKYHLQTQRRHLRHVLHQLFLLGLLLRHLDQPLLLLHLQAVVYLQLFQHVQAFSHLLFLVERHRHRQLVLTVWHHHRVLAVQHHQHHLVLVVQHHRHHLLVLVVWRHQHLQYGL